MSTIARTFMILAALLSAALVAPAQAQNDADSAPKAERSVPDALRSPRVTMDTFLQAMDDYQDAGALSPGRLEAVERLRSTMDLSRVGRDAAEQAGIYLLAVFNRIGRINPADLPGALDVERSGADEFTFFPDLSYGAHRELIDDGAQGEIVLAKNDDGAWRFTAETIDEIDELYLSVQDAPVRYGVDERTLSTSLWIRSQVPRDLRENEALGIELWQWIALLVIVFIGVVIDFALQSVLRVTTATRLRRNEQEVDPEILKRAVRPFGLFGGALAALLLLQAIGLPPLAQQILFTAARLVLMVAGVLAAFRVVDVLTDILGRRATATDTKIDDLLVPLARRALKIFVFAIGLVYIAESLSIEILPLLTGLGIGGLAVAFAAKDTIENFFGSMAVIFDRPFEVGHWVVIGDVEGTVEELGFRSTRIRTFYNSLVTVPNASLVRATVDNYGRRKYRRYKAELGVAYDTPPEKIDAFCEGIRELIRQHPYTRNDYYQVYFTGYGASSLNVLLYVFFETPDWSVELRERHRLLNDILRLAHKLGVEFAYPTQTLYLKRGEGGLGEQPADFAKVEDQERESIVVGRKLARSVTRDAAWREEKPGLVEFRGAEAIEEDPDSDSQVEQRSAGG